MEHDRNSLRDMIRELEQREILSALRECNGVMARAAKRLGITERMIGYKVRKYGITRWGSGEALQQGGSQTDER